MAVNPNTNFTTGAVYTADQANRFPRGVMGYASSTANLSLTTSTQDVLSLTFTAVTGRLYKATVNGFYQKSSNGRVFIDFTDGANVQQNASMSTTTNTEFGYYVATFLFTASSGSITRKIRSSTELGTATLFGNPADGRTYQFIIEDVGLS
jgi:hypothetical protein